MGAMSLFAPAPTFACIPAPAPGPALAPTRKWIDTCACAWTRSPMCVWTAPVSLHSSPHAYIYIDKYYMYRGTMCLFTPALASACTPAPAPGLASASTWELMHTCACAWTRTRMCSWAAPVYLHAPACMCLYIWVKDVFVYTCTRICM